MKSEWEVKPITNIVGFNPKHTVKKGALVSYVEMAAVPEHSREIAYFDNREFKSGSKFQNGDTLFSRITPCLQNGKTCRVSQLAKDEIANGSTEFIVMSAKNSIDKAFVYYLALSKEFRKYAEGRMEGTTGRQRVSWQSLSEYELPMPPKEIRKKISYTLSTLDDKIELNRRMNQTLEEMAQALFKSWFVDFDPVHAKNNATNDADYEQIAKELGISRKVLDLFPDKFEESGLGMIPIGWKVKELGDFFPVVTGKKNANIATNDGKYIFFTCSQSASKTDVYSFDAAAILLAGNCDFNVKWYRGKFEAYQRTYVLIPRDIEFLSFLYFLISYKLSDITQSSQGSVVKFITKGMIENYKIALPNEIVLKDLVGIFSNINFKIEGNLEQIKTLQKTRDTLLPKLLSGELDVSELELDNATH